MTASAACEVLWTATALEMLEGIGDRRVQQKFYDTSKPLESDPDKQGKPLRERLLGFRSLRAMGQRHRLIFSVSSSSFRVFVVAVGLRRAGARDDIYVLAERLIRLGLAPASVHREPEASSRPKPVTKPRPKRR